MRFLGRPRFRFATDTLWRNVYRPIRFDMSMLGGSVAMYLRRISRSPPTPRDNRRPGRARESGQTWAGWPMCMAHRSGLGAPYARGFRRKNEGGVRVRIRTRIAPTAVSLGFPDAAVAFSGKRRVYTITERDPRNEKPRWPMQFWGGGGSGDVLHICCLRKRVMRWRTGQWRCTSAGGLLAVARRRLFPDPPH